MSKGIKLTLNRETLRVLNHGALTHIAGGEITKPTICTTVTLEPGCETYETCVPTVTASADKPSCRPCRP